MDGHVNMGYPITGALSVSKLKVYRPHLMLTEFGSRLAVAALAPVAYHLVNWK